MPHRVNELFNSSVGRLLRVGRRAIAVAAFVSCAGMAVSGCATNLGAPPLTPGVADGSAVGEDPQRSPKRASPVTIAMLLPQQGFGQAALVGKGMKQAGEMALFESGNPAVQLIVKNDNGSPQGAAAAAREALEAGAEIIVGPLFGATVPAVAAVARPAGVPVMSFSNDRSVAGDGVYLMSYLPHAEVQRIIGFAMSRGKRRFAALIPAGEYGDRVEQAFRSSVQGGGGTIVALERFEPAANAMLEPAKRVFEVVKDSASFGLPVDALFLPGNQDTLPVLGPQIGFAGIDTAKVQMIGLGGWDYPNIGREQAFVGGWYPSPDPQGFQSFAERFAKTFGQAPPRVATQAYDAVRMAITLSNQPKGQRFTQANLTMPAGFEGVDGRFMLRPDGTAERGLAVLEVQRFGAQVIEGAGSAVGPAPGAAPNWRGSSVPGRFEPAQPVQPAVGRPLFPQAETVGGGPFSG